MIPSFAFLFPGQGSQAVGMGKCLYENDLQARALFENADATLGWFLSRMCFEGPEDLLKQTENTQPALYVCSAAAVEVLRGLGVEPSCVAGHSLGEYSALYAAGVVDFETGLRLVAARGKAMAEASRNSPGAMAAVIGLGIAKLDEVCVVASNGTGPVVVANDNCPGQVVISGTRQSVERACDLARAEGARSAIPLPVSGAFHSPLVHDAREVMEEELANAVFREPRCPFVSNVTAEPVQDPEAIRWNLIEQITSRVRWVESVRGIAAMGLTAGLEVGPGRVLAGLVRRISPEMAVYAAGTMESISRVLSAEC
jgi:[acyl-carrier-protein] S-malonyltransferase